MYISLYCDPQQYAILGGNYIPQGFDGNEFEVAPLGAPLYPTRRAVHVDSLSAVRISANAHDVTDPVTLLLEYSRDGAHWYSANASVTLEGDGVTAGEWEYLPAECYGDVQFRASKSDAGGVACLVVAIDLQLR